MLTIERITIENLTENCITDSTCPRFAFTLQSDRQGVMLEKATFAVNDWHLETDGQNAVYSGASLMPFSEYTLQVTAKSKDGDTASGEMMFSTGFMGTPFSAKWITDGSYQIGDDTSSPSPMTFVRKFHTEKQVKKAVLYITALGIYKPELNGKEVGNDYFAPGFTAYENRLQYQAYDVTGQIAQENCLCVTVAGGWACGSFTGRRNKLYADRQALLAEVHIEYEDGTKRTILTDESWQVAQGYRITMADIYDGESYDARICAENLLWKSASIETPRITPSLEVTNGAMVRQKKRLVPTLIREKDGKLLYDFGQNFAGVVGFRVNGKSGQVITVRHAEILLRDELATKLLRTAKATLTYTCRDGEQEYSPRFTYMGFRYIEISGARKGDIEVYAYVLHSDMEQTGDFSCNDARLNQLQHNILWGAKSNFMDIPTDCPQRDERMGWAGDIAMFAPTACYNFDTARFFDKWLRDMQSQQDDRGGIPDVIPAPPKTHKPAFKAFWGDACLLVPYAAYQQSGDKGVLERYYGMMRAYVDGVIKQAEKKELFKTAYTLYPRLWQAVQQYGDWCAPDCDFLGWVKRSRQTATASLKNLCTQMAEISEMLGDPEAVGYYREIAKRVSTAYHKAFFDDAGKLKKPFQTAYVLPLAYEMLDAENRAKALEELVQLVKANDYKIGTGFPGTPYILFVLADNGYADVAYRMLLNEECPSWLYEVKMGATTIWERWDAMLPDGSIKGEEKKDPMISFNHYASGAVGDFLYRRVLGIEQLEPGYRRFRVAPAHNDSITQAKGHTRCGYGKIEAEWSITEGYIRVCVPVGTDCHVQFGNVDTWVGSGEYRFEVIA